MERLYAPNKGYVLMERSHTYKNIWARGQVCACTCMHKLASARALLAQLYWLATANQLCI